MMSNQRHGDAILSDADDDISKLFRRHEKFTNVRISSFELDTFGGRMYSSLCVDVNVVSKIKTLAEFAHRMRMSHFTSIVDPSSTKAIACILVLSTHTFGWLMSKPENVLKFIYSKYTGWCHNQQCTCMSDLINSQPQFRKIFRYALSIDDERIRCKKNI